MSYSLFFVPIITWIVSQLSKAAHMWYIQKKFSLGYIAQLGGMPSSHVALMTSLTVSLYFEQGLSALLYVVFFLTLIIARDAFGVRLESAKHAMAINDILKEMDSKNAKHEKEWIGHTKKQVAIGVILGIIVPVLWYL